MQNETVSVPRLERLPAVCTRVGVGRSTIYRWINEGKFPAPARIGDHTAAWDARLIDRWIEGHLAKARPTAALVLA